MKGFLLKFTKGHSYEENHRSEDSQPKAIGGALVDDQARGNLIAASLHCPCSDNVVFSLSFTVNALTHLPVLLCQYTGNTIFGIERFRVDILAVDKPFDIYVNAAGLDDIGQDGVAMEEDLRLERVG